MLTTSRREFVVASSATIAAWTALQSSILAHAFPSQPGETVLPWLDQPPENPVPEVVANQLRWEDLDSWMTPNEQVLQYLPITTARSSTPRTGNWRSAASSQRR